MFSNAQQRSLGSVLGVRASRCSAAFRFLAFSLANDNADDEVKYLFKL